MKQKPKKVLLRELRTGHIFMIDDNYSFWYLLLKTEEKESYKHFLCLQEDGRIIKRILNKNILLILLNRDE
jgi:hypothetical protein